MPEMAETADMPRVEERAVYAMNAVLPPRTNPTFIPKVGTALEFRPVRTNNTRYMGLTATNTTGPWTMFTNVILDAPTTNALTNAFYFFYPDDGGPQRFFQVAATNLYL
jgi:hypothetical protein